jgi:hypothetical protein
MGLLIMGSKSYCYYMKGRQLKYPDLFPFQLQTFCDDFVVKSFKKEGKCRFKTTDPITTDGYFSLPLQKNSKFTLEFYLA